MEASMNREDFTTEQEAYARKLEQVWRHTYSVERIELFENRAAAIRHFAEFTKITPLPDNQTHRGCMGPSFLKRAENPVFRAWLDQQPKPYALYVAKKQPAASLTSMNY
jgi:hypothetical protein